MKMLYLTMSKKKNPLFVWGWDRKISPLGSPFFITRLTSWFQMVILGMDISIQLSHSLIRFLTLYLREMPFNTFAIRANPDQAALVRCAWSGSTLFAFANKTRYDPTLVDLTSSSFVLCTNVKPYLYDNSKWVELSINIHEQKERV